MADTFGVPVLETERLRLRSLRGADFEAYAAVHQDPEVMRFEGDVQPGALWDRPRSWRHLCYMIGAWQVAGVGMWAVEERESETFCGMFGFTEYEGYHPGFHLGGLLVRAFWGRGYASEAMKACMAFAFDILGRNQVLSLVAPEHTVSARLAERSGMSFLHLTEYNGRPYRCYGLDRAKYQQKTVAAAPCARRAGAPPSGPDPDRHGRNGGPRETRPQR